ncbi:MAG: hypothetical protein U9O94_06275 [Nanoarchaeota archaeon]|nr:hypothetical protein [Nanoarchaeota archaeon]
MRKYTNIHDISPALAVFLLYDDYDHDSRLNTLSATGLLKSTRQMVLIHQNKTADKQIDISDLVASRMGSALHDGCEKAWKDPKALKEAVKLWGVSPTVFAKIKINPEKVNEGDIPVYIEQRHEKKIKGWNISGKYDLVLDGTLNDYKSTSCWGYIYDSNAAKYSLQGSIYKWLNPEKITSDYININFIFTDWSAVKARQDRTYPQLRVITKKYPLMSIEDTEQWIMNKLIVMDSLKDSPQESLPECSKEELWATDTVYKYYKNPSKLSRATKNFSTMDEALTRKASDGDVGIIKTVPGQVKACRYCPVIDLCTQAQQLKAEGRLVL